jgi:hypothetical protein
MSNESGLSSPCEFAVACTPRNLPPSIHDNPAILSQQLTKYQASGNAKARALLKKAEAAAWRRIHLKRALHLPGRRTAHRSGSIVAGLRLGRRKSRAFGLAAPTRCVLAWLITHGVLLPGATVL